MKHKHLEKHALIRMGVVGVLFIACIISSLYGLTNNSLGAKERYDALIAVDKSGGDVESALKELRTYIYSHMNTQIGSDTGIKPPIQLQGTYERLAAAEKDRVTKANESLYTEAQADCERRQPSGFSGRNRLDCIEAYVDANGEKEKPIDASFYKFDFVPPRWSPDLAGFSIVFAVLLGCIFIVDVALYFRTRHLVQLGN